MNFTVSEFNNPYELCLLLHQTSTSVDFSKDRPFLDLSEVGQGEFFSYFGVKLFVFSNLFLCIGQVKKGKLSIGEKTRQVKVGKRDKQPFYFGRQDWSN